MGDPRQKIKNFFLSWGGGGRRGDENFCLKIQICFVLVLRLFACGILVLFQKKVKWWTRRPSSQGTQRWWKTCLGTCSTNLFLDLLLMIRSSWCKLGTVFRNWALLYALLSQLPPIPSVKLALSLYFHSPFSFQLGYAVKQHLQT